MEKQEESGFECERCHVRVSKDGFIGTSHRNHCPVCLWSKHVDSQKSGDRQSGCLSLMEPVGLTFKDEGDDKYGRLRQGELMIVHRCTGCGKISINRIAGDDSPEVILSVFEKSFDLDTLVRSNIEKGTIRLLTKRDHKGVKIQLFGKKG